MMNKHDVCNKMAKDIIKMLSEFATWGINAEHLDCPGARSQVTNYLLKNIHKLIEEPEWGNKPKPYKGWGGGL
ncbi:MAG: hypothetical protein ACFFCW_14320 [Candidatus Hodarchaeota archaeon]